MTELNFRICGSTPLTRTPLQLLKLIYFREEPVINTETISIDYLGSLGENTFGKEYWRFLTRHVNHVLSFAIHPFFLKHSITSQFGL